MPKQPEGDEERSEYDQLLTAVDAILQNRDGIAFSLHELAESTGIPSTTVARFFASPEAALSGLTLRYVEIGGRFLGEGLQSVAKDGWQAVVHEIFRRGREFYNQYTTARKLRFDLDRSSGVQHIILASSFDIGSVLAAELESLFVFPEDVDLATDMAHCIIITDGLWGASIARHSEITDEMAAEAERAVAGYLASELSPKLKLR